MNKMVIQNYKEIITIKGTQFFEGTYKGSKCFGVQQLSKQCMAVFNHKKTVLNALIKIVEDGGYIGRDYRNHMIVYTKGKTFHAPLSRVVWCLYNRLPYDKNLLSNNIRHKQKGATARIEDCRSSNLFLGGVSVFLDEDTQRVVVKSNTMAYEDVFEPMQIIVDILTQQHHALEWHFNRLMCKIDNLYTFPIADLAYLAYYHTDLTLDNYREKLENLKAYKNEHKLSVEHLNGNFHNHFMYNIALVKESLNSQKNDKITRIVEPYVFTVVYGNGKYRMVLGKADENLMIKCACVITSEFENVVGAFPIFEKVYPEAFNKEQARKNNTWIFFDRKFCEQIAQAPEEQFISLDVLSESEG